MAAGGCEAVGGKQSGMQIPLRTRETSIHYVQVSAVERGVNAFSQVWEERKIAATLPCRQHGAYAPRITIVRPYTNKKTNIRTNGILSIPHDRASATK